MGIQQSKPIFEVLWCSCKRLDLMVSFLLELSVAIVARHIAIVWDLRVPKKYKLAFPRILMKVRLNLHTIFKKKRNKFRGCWGCSPKIQSLRPGPLRSHVLHVFTCDIPITNDIPILVLLKSQMCQSPPFKDINCNIKSVPCEVTSRRDNYIYGWSCCWPHWSHWGTWQQLRAETGLKCGWGMLCCSMKLVGFKIFVKRSKREYNIVYNYNP